MIDFARINVRAGSGGNGAGSFRHIKGKRYGKADGGDGGNGGNVFLEATRDLNTLEPFRYIKDYKAADGTNGLSNLRRGADGEDFVLKVPVGTLVKVKSQSEESRENKLSTSDFDFDLVSEGQKVLVARGGQGGRGNSKLRDEFGRRPRAGESGEEGESAHLTLELKLIADVGLIGLPNSGKSTLLAALTAARPKIAPYPFTTLEPNLGVLRTPGGQVIRQSGNQVSDGSEARQPDNQITRSPRQLVLADIPGLIEGASKGKGLGDLFLRHIERTKVLVHLVDVSKVAKVSKGTNVLNTFETSETFETFDTSGVWRDYQTVRNELKAYSKELAKKKEIIVLNKIDQSTPQVIQSAVDEFAKHRKKVIAISAKTGEGLDKLVEMILK
ncbi:GTPase Obg [Candidatus Curtissbacteria bacterium]|nr:GTPase Obg [Candidatus Curtissbacteria bacterium]